MHDFTLYDLFLRNSRNFQDNTAITSNEATLSFGDLHHCCDALAARLGDIQGARVGLLAMNHPGFYILFGALARAGAIIVPINWRLSDEEVGYILQDCEPTLLYADSHYLERAKTLAAPLGLTVASLDSTLVFEHFTAPPPRPEVGSNDPVCIFYTAAVEGVPRGAVLSHANLLAANLQVITSMGLSRMEVNLAMLPLFHITGLNLALAVLQQGGKNVVMEKFDEADVLAKTAQEGVTIWGSFPPILSRMTEAIGENNRVPTLKYVVGLDGPDNIRAFEQKTDAKFWILYGQAETSGFVTFSQASDRLGSAGQQGPLSIFTLVNDEEKEVAAGVTGEIVVRGPLVFQGYWRQEKHTAWTFRNGWHHTGDLGQLDVDGFLHYKGRKPEKELIKPGGENVYPAEVEAVILKHPEIVATSVIGIPDPKFGEGVKAVCVLAAGSTLTEQELIAFVGERIARYKKPGYVQFVEELPMGDGKIDRMRVKELYG